MGKLSRLVTMAATRQELQDYLGAHKIQERLNDWLNEMVKERPAAPYAWLATRMRGGSAGALGPQSSVPELKSPAAKEAFGDLSSLAGRERGVGGAFRAGRAASVHRALVRELAACAGHSAEVSRDERVDTIRATCAPRSDELANRLCLSVGGLSQVLIVSEK